MTSTVCMKVGAEIAIAESMNGRHTKSNGKSNVVEMRRESSSLMSKVDAKAGETIELKKGTLWLIGIVPVFLMLVFNWGGSIINFVRDDQTKTEKLNQLQQELIQIKNDQKEVRQKLDDIQKNLHQEAIQKAKIVGFEAGVAESQAAQTKKQ